MPLRSPLHRAIRDRMRSVRKAHGMTVAELARLSGVTAGALHLIESGKSVPGVDTVEKIAKALRVDPRWFGYGYGEDFPMFQEVIAPGFAPVKLIEELNETLRGHCGKIDDTYKYLDSFGASLWCALLRQPDFAKVAQAVPIEEAAELLAPHVEDLPIDLIGLGAGTAVHELNLVDALPPIADIRLLLLDVSQPLLAEASAHVQARMPRSRFLPVMGILGNFHQLPLIARHLDAHGPRRRVVTMFGYTFGNLENELRFLRNSLSWLSPGDILVLDVMKALAPASDPALIASTDPALTTKRTPDWFSLVQQFLTGPIRRGLEDVVRISVEPRLDLRSCAIPGSYAIEMQASVETSEGPTRNFSVGYSKRYEVDGLKDCLAHEGWHYLAHFDYASGADMLCVFQRATPAPKRRRQVPKRGLR